MEAKPLTPEQIALAAKKVDMTLDDIIKMSKTSTTKTKKQRVPNRGMKFSNNAPQEKSLKSQRLMETRSFHMQGALARRRSNFQGNQFPFATEAARKAAVAPISNRPNRPVNRNRTFNVNKQRVRSQTQQKFAPNGSGLAVKKPFPPANSAPRQKPQTLDSLFANMKEQRMRSQQNSGSGSRRNGSSPRTWIAPWARNLLRN